MENGELSTEAPRTIWVSSDLLLEVVPAVVISGRDRGSIWRPKKKSDPLISALTINRSVISQLWRYQERTPLRMDMLHFDDDPENAHQQLASFMDSISGSPVASVAVYQTPTDAQAALAYRPDVVGVVDTQEHLLRWGNRAMSLSELTT